MRILYLKLLLLFVFIYSATSAQFKFISRVNGNTRMALEKIITGYKEGFNDLKGDVIEKNPQSIEYECLQVFPAAESSKIIEYPGGVPVYSWAAQILATEDYDEARKKYSSLYNDFKQMHLTIDDGNRRLLGNYEAPSESKKFFETILYLSPGVPGRLKIKLKLAMEYEFPEWKVHLLLYEKEEEDSDAIPADETPKPKKPLI
jgi:hypothetical protein